MASSAVNECYINKYEIFKCYKFYAWNFARDILMSWSIMCICLEKIFLGENFYYLSSFDELSAPTLNNLRECPFSMSNDTPNTP